MLSSGSLTGDIWSSGAFSFESPLRELLDSGEYSIEQLLVEDELLQEIRGVHPKLIEYFSTPQAVTKLVYYVTLPPDTPVPRPTSETTPENNEKQQGGWLKSETETIETNKSKHPEQDPEMLHVRFPYMACEIICCEVNGVIQQLVQGFVTPEPPDAPMRILDMLFQVLFDTQIGKLDDYRAGYFEKILSLLFRKRPEEMSTYINQGGRHGKDALIKNMLDHLYSHSIMQVAQRLLMPKRPVPQKEQDVMNANDEGGEAIIPEALDPSTEDNPAAFSSDWPELRLPIDTLLDKLIANNEDPEDEQTLNISLHASEVLITVIQNSLLNSKTMLTLTSPEILERLITSATTTRGDYFSPHESLVTSSLSVLESLILQLGGYGAVGTMSIVNEETSGEPTEEQVERDLEMLISDLSSFLEQLPRLLDGLSALLRHPSTKEWTSPTQYSKTVPQPMLGSSRLHIVRVIEAFVLLGDLEVDQCLVKSDCLEICLDLFWQFQWCSMLHQSVANLLVHIFEGRNSRCQMQEYLVVQCNLLGRLMDSFVENQESNRVAEASLDEVMLHVKDINDSKEESSDLLPVSEDDVDAAMEKEEDDNFKSSNDVEPLSTPVETRDASTPQSFRMGYMGHVIIICQALVHACSNEDEELQGTEEGAVDKEKAEEEKEPLFLIEIIEKHPLSERWQGFVTSTLSAETAVQSTPLGDFNGVGVDSLHPHRPGLIDDDGDDGAAVLPPRGMLGGGEVIDMDDHDLDIAATMMANLGFGRHDAFSDDDADAGSGSGSGDSQRSYDSGETANSGGYLFDDPLGKNGGLGIELGKLSQYKRSEKDDNGKKTSAKDNGSDNSSSSSSDEEPEHGRQNSDDVPVMDLFAGNFDYDAPMVRENTFSADFADFTTFQANFENQLSEEAVGDSKGAMNDASNSSSKESEIEEIFGKGDHAELLLDQDFVEADEAEANGYVLSSHSITQSDESKLSQNKDYIGTSLELNERERSQTHETSENASVASEILDSDDLKIVAAPSDELAADTEIADSINRKTSPQNESDELQET